MYIIPIIIAAVAFLISLFLTKVVIIFCKKYSFYDSTNARKIHTGNIPRLGGVAFVLSFFAALVVYSLVFKGIPVKHSVPLIVSGSIIFFFCILDDFLDIRAVIKLCVQIIAVTIVVLNGFRFESICGWKLPLWFSYLLTFGWCLGLINAYNLIDGLDSLCGFLSLSVFKTIGITCVVMSDMNGFICIFLATAILGFLVFNMPPAKIFMGDCGSQFLGFMIAVTPLSINIEKIEFNKFLLVFLLSSIPVFDTIATIWRRIRDHRSVMAPDRLHLHHKLLNLGLSIKGTLVVIALIQCGICISAALSMFMPEKFGTVILILALMFVTLAFSMLHFIHWNVLKKHNQLGVAVPDLTK